MQHSCTAAPLEQQLGAAVGERVDQGAFIGHLVDPYRVDAVRHEVLFERRMRRLDDQGLGEGLHRDSNHVDLRPPE
jgi:hypothetical protein